MAQSRVTAIFLTLSSAVLLAACGDSDSPSTNGSAGPETTSDATVAWANGVCTASTELDASVQSAGDKIRAVDASTAPDEVRSQVKSSVTEVQDAAANLARILAGKPGGVVPETAQAQEDLLVAGAAAQSSVDKLNSASDQVGDAKTPEELTSSLAGLKTAATEAATGLAAYREAVRNVAVGSAEAVKYAFQAAPACQSLIVAASASPSS
ncbi:hypothetical protein ACFQFC_07120 [Amorphoplanes digitatis]|uniref:Formate-dependent phosphoribosylglycinamide formyltransferase (GAR transformylase) n=1 Tax=Actinoplanes digitatis TaxID=1868 RepID=A0A7W7MR82_9ACTN|nr:hypothetical protein [Actinoplanes digitatis]MBB4763971.1 formate-dependent phosphoribosylglycinamide formyltransferase (GAR transformylase) [Actinoplanes digitatis]BFE73271.1 hypothetical protein GCM10020092_065720 [Actinoplanes digitatis]GID93790.1 hypothetical protein Adi01nite_32020 [Actinoplanes digitatis]